VLGDELQGEINVAQGADAGAVHRLSACWRMCSAPSPAAGADDAAVGPGPGGSAIGGDSSMSTALSARLCSDAKAHSRSAVTDSAQGGEVERPTCLY
jgi:hypothetical protein